MSIEELLTLNHTELTKILNSMPALTLEKLSLELNERIWQLQADIQTRLDTLNRQKSNTLNL